MSRTGRAENALWKKWAGWEKRFPRRVVLIDATSGRAYSARELSDAARGFSARLEPLRPGERLAFQLPNGVEWMAFFLGLQRAGLSAMPLDNGLPADACRESARRLGAHAVFLGGAVQKLDAECPRRAAVCCVKVTSGSAGEPKAIACRPEHLIADGRQVIATMGLRAGDLNLATIPLGHSYGLGNLVLPLILQGTAMVCAPTYVPRQIVDWIVRYRVTALPSVPAVFRVLAGLPASPQLPSLRLAISAGAPLNPEIAQGFFSRFGVKIHNFYGSSETGGICYDTTGSASLTGRSVGKPLKGVAVSIRAGKIAVASRAVATRSGRFLLPDSGEFNKRGELVLLGRGGALANIGGKKVHPLEVERAIRSLPGVSDVAVWLWRTEGRDLLAAAVESRHVQAEIERSLAALLPAWKWPKVYFLATDLPRNARGKLDLPKLRLSVHETSRPMTRRPRATSA